MAEGGFAAKVKRAVRNNFNQSAAVYGAFEEQYRFFYTLTRKLVEWMDVKRGARVLDVGCGNGVSCVALREMVAGDVYGIDLSEGMIEDARRRISDPHIHLFVGDGERMEEVVPIRDADAVLYNASIFVFPDPKGSFEQARCLLKKGGCLGFSFYPRVYAPGEGDLIGWAYEKVGYSLPKFRTITSWDAACQALREVFGDYETTTYEMPGTVAFLTDFFSIPAQSASLFPKLSYETRAAKVKELFAVLGEWEGRMKIGWDMAKAWRR